jgi:hypothetical protein
LAVVECSAGVFVLYHTYFNLRPSNGFSHLHKASTENTASQEGIALPGLLGPERTIEKPK